jgi:hypothetical protein
MFNHPLVRTLLGLLLLVALVSTVQSCDRQRPIPDEIVYVDYPRCVTVRPGPVRPTRDVMPWRNQGGLA